MKTVLFINKGESELWSSFLRYDFLVNEYLKDGLFDVCEWHANGSSVRSAIPGLDALLDGEEEWTAVVATDLRAGRPAWEHDIHYDNLFDFPESYGLEACHPLRESERPVVRLTQMLGGLPEKVDVRPLEGGPKTYEDAFVGYEVNRELDETYYDLLERYRLGVPRPQRIVCVTPRDVNPDLERLLRKDADAEDVEPCDFWQRNDYPANARFVVCDRMALAACGEDEDAAATRARVDKDWFRFWMSVLTLTTARIPPECLQAFRVYRLEAALDEGLLEQALSHRYSEWLATRERIEFQQELEQTRLAVSEHGTTELPSCETHIPVVFETVEEENLRVDSSEVGLLKDRPARDRSVWQRQKMRALDAFRDLLRAPQHALANAAAQFRRSNRLPEEELEYCVLNEFQRSNLEDDLRAIEYVLARDIGERAFVFESYRDRLERESEHIVDGIEARPSTKQLFGATGVAVVALCVGFAPYCFGLTGGFGASLAAFGVTAACCVVLVGVTAVATLLARSSLRSAYQKFNDVMDGILERFHGDATRLSKRVSSYATFEKSWSILARQQRCYASSARSVWLGRQDALLRTRMKDILAIAPGCAIDRSCYSDAKCEDWELIARKLQNESFFNICHFEPLSRPLNEERDASVVIDVPFEFITAVRLDPLAIRKGGSPCCA